MHPLLTRQLAKLGLSAAAPPDAAAWQQLLTGLAESLDRAGQECEPAGRPLAPPPDGVRALQDQLKQANEALEARVGARTQELHDERAGTALSLHFSRVLHALRDLDGAETGSFLEAVTRAGARTLNTGRAGVWLFDRDRSAIVCRDLFNGASALHERGAQLRAADYPRYVAALTGDAVLDAASAETDPRTSELAAAYLRPHGITSTLDAPLRLGRRLYGVLRLEHTGPARRWSEEEKTFAAALAGIVMHALEQDVLRRTQVAQQAAEQQLRALLDGLPDRISLKDAAGRYLALNRKEADFYGQPMADMVGRSVRELQPPEQADAIMADDARAMRAPGPVRVERKSYLNGIWHEITKVPVRNDNGSLLGLIAISRDITARKEAEQALLAAKEAAENASAAKDTFLATMSHEIRTPMNGLMGTLELLALSSLDREQAETLAIARQSGRAMGRIIDDILDHAKIEAGKMTIVSEPVELAALLPRIVNAHHAVADAKGLILRHAVDPRISPALLADPLRLLQVLGNFVSNAIKFTQDGVIELRAGFIERRGSRGNYLETVCLSVKDTGIGMTAETQARLFKPFEQASVDTARLYGGTGLGLAISRRLAEMMGGGIVIDSAPGTGTTMSVTLTLPVAAARPMMRTGRLTTIVPLWTELGQNQASWFETSMAPAGGPAAAGAGAGAAAQAPCVLAVDDSPTNRLLIARQLKLLGLQVQTAADGNEAFGLWRASQFALVLTDLNMPAMDGFGLSRAIRASEAARGCQRTPVLAWTANALSGIEDQCSAAGMDDVLVKPAELEQIKEILARWLPRGRVATAAAVVTAAATAAVTSATAIAAAAPSPAAAASAPAGPGSAIDLKLLGDPDGDDKEDVLELVYAVREALRDQIPEVTAALDGGQLPAIQMASHKMKGSAGMIGAQVLVEVCKRMETAAGAGDAAPLPDLHRQFVTETGRVMAALDAL